jgi:hypothetical protein
MKSKEVLLSVKEEMNILHAIKIRKANWICSVLGRNCLLQHVMEGKIQERIEVTEQEEEDGSSYWVALKITGN